MTKILVLMSFVLFFVFTTIIFDPEFAYAKTGSYNFCEVFPAFPECGGWRSEPLSDNFWYCEYVYLEKFCDNPPPLEKQISTRSEDYCCRYLGDPLDHFDPSKTHQILTPEQLTLLQTTDESIFPAIIWTDRDHYNFLDRVQIYGKLDFANASIEKNLQDLDFIQTGVLSNNSTVVDVILNGRTIIREVPVNENGWFSAFYFLNDRYKFSTQNNLLEVEYILSSGVVPLGGPKTHTTYHFTTGNVSNADDAFEIWMDDTSLPRKIQYGVIVENQERFINLDRQNLIITRMITPDGYVIPVDSKFTIKDLSNEYDGFKDFGPGTYHLQITYGNNTSSKSFTY